MKRVTPTARSGLTRANLWMIPTAKKKKKSRIERPHPCELTGDTYRKKRQVLTKSGLTRADPRGIPTAGQSRFKFKAASPVRTHGGYLPQMNQLLSGFTRENPWGIPTADDPSRRIRFQAASPVRSWMISTAEKKKKKSSFMRPHSCDPTDDTYRHTAISPRCWGVKKKKKKQTPSSTSLRSRGSNSCDCTQRRSQLSDTRCTKTY